MTGFISQVNIKKTIATITILFAFGTGLRSVAQMPQDSAPYDATPASYAMSENELTNLVAPIALYPDELLGQVLVACTYPDEVVAAQWWLEQNGNLPGAQLMDAARQQNWDPSVQLLVAFPDVLALLNRDLRWTTELGNAFLGQQADVMNAIQDLRAQARRNEQLASTPQLAVNTEWQGGRSAIDIQPADPQRMFIPSYDPYAVWGTPAEGDYPSLPYSEGSDFGSLIGSVANLAGLLPGFTGLLGPRGWGWALSWLGESLFVNNSFFSDFGFHNGNGGLRGTSLWVHDGNRRFGGRYGNNSLASWHGREGVDRDARGFRNFGERAEFGSGERNRDSFGRYGAGSGESFRGDPRAVRGGDWRRFSRSSQTASAGDFGRTFPQSSRSRQSLQPGDRGLQRDYRSRDSYFATSGSNRSSSYNSRSVESSSRYNGFAKFGKTRKDESSRRLVASRSWGRENGKEPHFSAARLSTRHEHESGKTHGFSSHSSRPKQPKFKEPKFKAPHYAKAHNGGHSSKEHSGNKHHG